MDSSTSLAPSFSNTATHGRARKNIFIVHPSALITDYKPHGDGLLTYRYICELAARGHRLSVACEQVELANPVPANVSLYPLPARTKRGLLSRLAFAYEMRQLFKRLDSVERFDVAHQLNPVFTGLSLGLIGVRVPLVLGVYFVHWPYLRSSRLKAIVLDTICYLQQRVADAIVVSGPAARARVVSRRQRADRTHIIPCGIDLTAFPEQPFPGGDPVILYLAAIHERKGIFVLLRAFDLVARRLPTVQLLIAGDGEGRSQAEAMARKSVFADRIRFLGTVARADVSKTMAQSTVFCSPSFGEPYGMNIIEAMATGRPVVSTRAGGPVDLIDPRGGALVPPKDHVALADSLITILETPGLPQAMGSFNRSVARTYSWTSVIDQLEAVYNTLSRPVDDPQTTPNFQTRAGR
jgi:glycosyltransferase involved in cell wall biosynthesis